MQIYCGFDKMIRVFDTSRPGRDHVNMPTYKNKKRYVAHMRTYFNTPHLASLHWVAPVNESDVQIFAPMLQWGPKRNHIMHSI